MIQRIEISEHIAEYIKKNFGEEYFNKYNDYYKAPIGCTSLRLSTLEEDHSAIIENLTKYGIYLKKHEKIPNAYLVESGADKIGKTLDYSFGKYYIQSLSSMIPPLVLDPKPGERVLDLCSAPGSKSTQLAEMMKNRGTLILNESSNGRIKSLVFNIDKMNFTNAGIILGKGELLSAHFNEWFDKILVDAPCSALGIMHKKGEVNNWWTERHASGLSDLQLKLLIAGIKMLKPGGEIVYSTCTLTIEENELVLDKVLNKYPVEMVDITLPVKSSLPFKEFEGITFQESVSKAPRIIPWEIDSEGFFVAKLRKTGNTEPVKPWRDKRENLHFVEGTGKKIEGYLNAVAEWYGIERSTLNNYKYIIKNNDIYFVNRDWDYSGPDIFLRTGSKFGAIDKRDYIRLHTLAAQALGNNITKNIISLENEDHLNTYLNGGIIKKDFGPAGQKVISYQNKIIGTAVNTKEGLKSQYPRAFRTQEVLYE
jgi:16S rRNA (cytosine1407-C5)-methyltransferase